MKTNNTIWVWGQNGFGQLGLADYTDRATPSQIGVDSDWSIITAGTAHTLGIKTNGTLWAWGSNESSQLGIGDAGNSTVPTLVGE